MLRVCCALVVVCLSVSCSNPPPEAAPPPQAAAASPAGGDHGGDTPHGDHSPHYGGTVYMKGDLHFEVVLDPAGTHRVYFSDATRAELPAATASEVSLTLSSSEMPAETLPGTVDESGESWIVSGSPLAGGDITARVAFVVGDEPYWIDVPYLGPELTPRRAAAKTTK